LTELLYTLSGSLVRLHRQHHPTLSLQLGQYPLQVIAYISRYNIGTLDNTISCVDGLILTGLSSALNLFNQTASLHTSDSA
jgi:hypothetical protein